MQRNTSSICAGCGGALNVVGAQLAESKDVEQFSLWKEWMVGPETINGISSDLFAERLMLSQSAVRACPPNAALWKRKNPLFCREYASAERTLKLRPAAWTELFCKPYS